MSVEPPERAPNSVNGWLVAVLLVLVAVLIYRFTGGGSALLHDPNATSRTIEARGDLAEDEKSTIAMFRAASPSVVHITTTRRGTDRFRLNILEIPSGTGSGIIWDSKGYIVTNAHVVKNADGARVTLSDNSTWPARLVGTDPGHDIAVLKIDAPATKLTPIAIGSSADLQVGQKVFAIGNPFGLDQTLTSGLIGGLGREIEAEEGRQTLRGLIHTDAAINPGNSGGPLLDSAGRAIGINTAILSRSGTYSGVSFAIPIDEVNLIVPQLIQGEASERPGLAVYLWNDAILERARSLGALTDSTGGVLIREVMPGGPAAQAGLRGTSADAQGNIEWGDLIIAIDGQTIEKAADLHRFIGEHKVGDSVRVTYLREGTQHEVEVSLEALPSFSD